jgi:hypothetical protein
LRLHFQQHRGDAGDFGEPLAAFIGAMPSDQPGIDLVDLRLQLRILLGLGREQVEPRRAGSHRLGCARAEDRGEAFLGGGKAELACISLLRAIDFEFNIILPSGRAASPGKTNASRMGRYCLAKSMTCG